MERPAVERRLALFSIIFAILHFFGETWAFITMGSFLPMLLVDYIAIGLLLFGGVRSLQTGRGAGLLCGAWGFTFCLAYRAFFWRVEVLLEGNGTSDIEFTTRILAAMLLVSLAAFLVAIALCNPPRSSSPS